MDFARKQQQPQCVPMWTSDGPINMDPIAPSMPEPTQSHTNDDGVHMISMVVQQSELKEQISPSLLATLG